METRCLTFAADRISVSALPKAGTGPVTSPCKNSKAAEDGAGDRLQRFVPRPPS